MGNNTALILRFISGTSILASRATLAFGRASVVRFTRQPAMSMYSILRDEWRS
ncbi:MAG: hypothetical protein K1W14_06590 [Muribaculaceae bacterium]